MVRTNSSHRVDSGDLQAEGTTQEDWTADRGLRSDDWMYGQDGEYGAGDRECLSFEPHRRGENRKLGGTVTIMANKECLKPWICYHPGEMLQEKLQEENMSVGDFVTRSQVPADIVRDIINGDASISSDIAIAFEQVTHIPAHLWINLQHSYDDYILKQQRPSYLSRILRLANRAAVM